MFAHVYTLSLKYLTYSHSFMVRHGFVLGLDSLALVACRFRTQKHTCYKFVLQSAVPGFIHFGPVLATRLLIKKLILVPVSLRKPGGLTPQIADPFSKARGPKIMKIQSCPGGLNL